LPKTGNHVFAQLTRCNFRN